MSRPKSDLQNAAINLEVGKQQQGRGMDDSAQSHPDLEPPRLGDVLDALEGLVLLSVQVQPAHFESRHGHLAYAEGDADRRVAVRRGSASVQIDL